MVLYEGRFWESRTALSVDVEFRVSCQRSEVVVLSSDFTRQQFRHGNDLHVTVLYAVSIAAHRGNHDANEHHFHWDMTMSNNHHFLKHRRLLFQ